MSCLNKIMVIGAGLAGCEAAWQISKRGICVDLYEMKPKKFSLAHKISSFAELVCSNSFKAERLESSQGLLKEELKILDSLILNCAYESRVPAGGALAVDREKFSDLVTKKIKSNGLINVVNEEVKSIDGSCVTVVATGPLTSDDFSKYLSDNFSGLLSFYDAASPIITKESIDMNYAFFGARYQRGDEFDYLNCPMTEEEYESFYNELIHAERAKLHDFDVKKNEVYEGCMPVEVMAKRGVDTIRFGPMKPVGLKDPKTGKRPFAVLQLRKENIEASLYNLVGFQTNLKFSEQRRVFGMIRALKNAEFVRYGVMHRNTFIKSPVVLESDYSLKGRHNMFFAGQITGVEGYMESTASGLIAGINAYLTFEGKKRLVLPSETMIGSLSRYISDESVKNFQPMGANFGILPCLDEKIRNKTERYRRLSIRSIETLKKYLKEQGQ